MASSTVSRRVSEFVGVALFGVALIWLISLASYNASDPVWYFNTGSDLPPANFAGRIGAFGGELSYQMFGYSAYLIPIVLVVIGWHYFWCRALDAAYTKLIGAGLMFGCVSSFLSLAFGTLDIGGKTFRAGGLLGDRLAVGTRRVHLNRYRLDRPDPHAAVSRHHPVDAVLVRPPLLHPDAAGAGPLGGGPARPRTSPRRESAREAASGGAEKASREGSEGNERGEGTLEGTRCAGRHGECEGCKDPFASFDSVPSVIDAFPDHERGRGCPQGGLVQTDAASHSQAGGRERTGTPLPEPEKGLAERKKGAYTLPPYALLDAAKGERKIDERQLMDGARLLEEKCREFAVEGTVVQIHPGPVVTTYEFKPDAGVKYSKITGLADDLCLAMQAESVIIDRIPGKSTVGIQIPNPNREQISLRELLESEVYKRSSSRLTLAMGKTIHGEPFLSDLATMPHLLIAGSTGAGKSVSVNAMITSILMRATPDDVRFIMVDPKRLELGMYEDIPHLLTPVVMDPKLAANALRWAVREMEERYKTLAAFGVRNIEQYNRNVRAMQAEKKPGEPVLDDKGNEVKPLPFIVVLIDELADLMMVAGNEVEESIARLAQMARAIGIHLVLATQRPSVDVITGLIKANLPARISFRVSSKIDSRTILDGNGAEQLLGKGDMLYLPPASSRFVRLHGPYISEQESARLASFLRKQGKPTYDTTVTADEKASQEHVEFEKDPLYDEAARIVVSSGQASISYLQRRLRIGFSRAARLVDMMEMDGLVSAAAGGKPREVLVKKDYFEEVDAQLR